MGRAGARPKPRNSAAASGRLTEERIDQSVYRILALKQAYGLTNDPIEMPDVQALNEEIAALNA